VSYDHEPIFATGSMLGVTDCFAVLDILDVVEQMGLDVMSAGVALAWATEALEKGVVTPNDTLLPLKFGDHNTYEKAVRHLAYGANDFYRLLAQGTLKAAAGLIGKAGARVVEIFGVVGLPFLDHASALKEFRVTTLVQFASEHT
jgi:aldehyde:ferredoxin oxidoreductase